MPDFLEMALKSGNSIAQTTLAHEMRRAGKTGPEIRKEMFRRYSIMKGAAKRGVKGETVHRSGLVRGDAKKFYEMLERRSPMTGNAIGKGIAYALAVSEVNASMGLIVAAPTAGSCGILPGVLLSLEENFGSGENETVDAMLTASGIGIVIAERATFAAAVAGCAAEIGASASMASAAIAEFSGGSKEQALDAAAISLKSYLGLVCDPVAGLVQVPCIKRNAIGVSNAFSAAEMALSGIESTIPFGEVVDAMYRIGKRLPPELRETSMGGLAVTPTALKVRALMKETN